jgi:hypothetical protein
VSGESLYLMSPMEVVLGYLFGHTGSQLPATSATAGPRRVLEDVVREALLRPPCGVAFSGGRDSSVVLAVATHVARRDGLPEPVPITREFPGVSEAEESRWQEMVVRHLGLRDWHRVTIPDGDLDFIGPIAAKHLLEHGIVWPPAIAADSPLIEAVPGGSVIDGEGGDEVLGVTAHRIGLVMHLLRQPRPLRWRRVRAALHAVSPALIRVRTRQTWVGEMSAWLRPAANDALLDVVADVERERPLSFATSVRTVPSARALVMWTRNRQILARPYQTALSSPLIHPAFVRAIARDGGRFGRGDRTATLRALVADLLPDEVLSRPSKATFNTCYMAQHTREFATQWGGDGVDHDLVDPEQLQRAWLAERPTPMTAALLQQAWRATRTAVVPAQHLASRNLARDECVL